LQESASEPSEAEIGESSSDEDNRDEFDIEHLSSSPSKTAGRSRNSKPDMQPIKNLQAATVTMGHTLRFMSSFCAYRGKIPYRPVIRWMMQRYNQHVTNSTIFSNLLMLHNSELLYMTLENIKEYRPETQYSVHFSSKQFSQADNNSTSFEDCQWQSLQLFSGITIIDIYKLIFFSIVFFFSGCLKDGIPMLFAGGPVTAMAWCPTPLGEFHEQLLAVTCHQSMDSTPNILDINEHPGLVQLWNMGILSNCPSSAHIPHLTLGLCHKWGTIRQLAWCPSGCWHPTDHLYGLLAAACADGRVHIFPVRKLNESRQQFQKAQVNIIGLLRAHQEWYF
jgi:hypothetical protein